MSRICLALGAAFVAFAFAGASRAADPAKEGQKLPVYKGTLHLHEDGKEKEVEKEFDLSKEADRNELIEAIKHGHVEHLAKEEEIGIGMILGLKRWDLGCWSLLVFLAILFILGRFAWKPMLQGLNEREQRIRNALDLAEQTRKEAAEQQAKLQAQIVEGAGKVREMMEEGRRDAMALKDQMIAEARAEIHAERQRLHREIETAKDAALEELWEKAVSLATQLSSKAIRRSLTADDHRRLLDETLAELRTGTPGTL